MKNEFDVRLTTFRYLPPIRGGIFSKWSTFAIWGVLVHLVQVKLLCTNWVSIFLWIFT